MFVVFAKSKTYAGSIWKEQITDILDGSIWKEQITEILDDQDVWSNFNIYLSYIITLLRKKIRIRKKK